MRKSKEEKLLEAIFENEELLEERNMRRPSASATINEKGGIVK